MTAIQPIPEIEPIPIRLPGYFAACYTREDIALDNLLSKAAVIKAPKDLEWSWGICWSFIAHLIGDNDGLCL